MSSCNAVFWRANQVQCRLPLSGAPVFRILMNRLFASFLLCLAMFALPFQGAAAAVMMVCSAAEAAGLSMPERHAAIKAEAGPLYTSHFGDKGW